MNTSGRVARLACLSALAACGSESATIDAGADAGLTVAIFGTVTAYKLPASDGGLTGTWMDPAPVAGMTVCLRGSAQPCVTTAADGTYRLEGAPASAQVAIGFEHPDYGGRQLIQRVTGLVDYRESPPLVTTESFNRYLTGSGCVLPLLSGTGGVYVGAPPGASIAATPSMPFVYMGTAGFDATATGVSPLAPTHYAAAVVCGLAPGTYDLDFGGTTGTCRMSEGWPVAGHDMRVVVESGVLTIANWICQ